MLRARQALDDARDAEGTFGWLASRLLRQRISDIPDQDYEEWQYLSKMQLQGKGNEEELRNQVVRVLAGGAVRSPTGHRMFIKGEHQIEDIAIANGVSFYDTPFMARVGFLLRKAEELRCSTPPTRAGSVTDHATQTARSGERAKRKTPGSVAREGHREITRYGLHYPDTALIFCDPEATYAVMNGVVEFESHPRISKARSAVMPVMSAQPPKSAGKAMQSVRNHFREGLSQPIGYLVICMQMKSGWLGMLYQGTKFTRLAALSPNTIAIEFGEHNPHFWAEPSWDSTSADAENGPSALKAPTDNTTTQLDSIAPGFQELTTPTVITMEQIFDLPNRLHERLGFELVKQDTLNSQLPDLNEDAVQTLLDFFVAAAFDRLHLPLSAANEAIDWSKVEDCPLHKHLLSMCAQAAINQDLHDEVAWRAGPQKITRALVRKVNQSAVPELQDQTPSTTAATHRDSEYIVQKRRRLERDHSRDVDGHDEDGVESSSSGSSEDPDKSDHHSSKSHGGDNGKDDKSGGDRDAQNHSRHSFDDNGSVRSSSRRSSASSNSSHRGDDDVDDGGRVQRGHPSMERQNDGSASDNIDHHSDSRGPAEAESCSAQQHWRSSTGGLFYAINDARRQKNLSYKCRLEALRDLGIKLVAVSTADMNTIIEEHIQAFDRYDDTGSGSGTHPRTAGDSGRSLGHESVTSEHQPSTRPRTLPRQSDESETSERLSIMLAPAGSSVKQAFLRPSSTDAALSGGEGITSRMRDLSLGKAAPKPSTMRSSPTPDQTA